MYELISRSPDVVNRGPISIFAPSLILFSTPYRNVNHLASCTHLCPSSLLKIISQEAQHRFQPWSNSFLVALRSINLHSFRPSVFVFEVILFWHSHFTPSAPVVPAAGGRDTIVPNRLDHHLLWLKGALRSCFVASFFDPTPVGPSHASAWRRVDRCRVTPSRTSFSHDVRLGGLDCSIFSPPSHARGHGNTRRLAGKRWTIVFYKGTKGSWEFWAGRGPAWTVLFRVLWRTLLKCSSSLSVESFLFH